MKKLLLTLLVITPLAASADDTLFQPWCDTYTAQGMVSLAANRIFGRSSTLNDEQYQARSEWVETAYRLAVKRFTTLTGKDFDETDMYAITHEWVNQCQIKDQIK